MNKKILVIGGYGSVGRIIATQLVKKFPGQVIVVGRNYQKAQNLALMLNQQVIPIALDISGISDSGKLLDDVEIVIMCLDQENIKFARQCIQRGIHYIDISASHHILSKIEALNKEAEKTGATAVLSVGLAPGLTNLLAKHCQSKLPDMTYADIYILLGLGEVHGDAAYRWTLENLNTDFTIIHGGEPRKVKGFEDGKQSVFPNGIGRRIAYRFNFSDQKVIPQTLGLRSVSTRLCFDSALMTYLFALAKRIGLSRILMMKDVKESLISVLKRLHFGSDKFVIKVEAGNLQSKEYLYECSLWGTGEAKTTGLVAAKVAENLALSSFPAGVFHIEQLYSPLEFLKSLGQDDLNFEEKVCSAR